MSNKKTKFERTRTPQHLSTSQYVCKSNAHKRFSPNLSRKPNLNETVGVRPGASSDPKFKTKLSASTEFNYEVEFDMAYNDYLQMLMKKQLVMKKVEEQRLILEDQLVVQTENLQKRQKKFKAIIEDTESFQTKTEIVQLVDLLEQSLVNFSNICVKCNIKSKLDQFKHTLNLECDKIILRNIKVLESREEYEKFIHTLESCLTATQKIINSGRNFEEVHNLAESIRNLYSLVDSVEKSEQTNLELKKNAVFNFLQNMSDFFALSYNEQSF